MADDELANALMRHLPPEFWRDVGREESQARFQDNQFALPPLANMLAGVPVAETQRWRALNPLGGDEHAAAALGDAAREGDWLRAFGAGGALAMGVLPGAKRGMPLSRAIREMSPEAFSDYLAKKYGADVNLVPQRNDIKLQHIAVPPEQRNRGIGSAIMDEIAGYADANSKRVVLTPANRDDGFGTTSRNRLIDFYRRHDYVRNKGRNKDFRIMEGMFRRPATED